jgi:hypothetical protein
MTSITHKNVHNREYNYSNSELTTWTKSSAESLTESRPQIDHYSNCSNLGKNNQVAQVKDRLGDRRGSEWEPIKILLQGENSAYAPNSQPRIPTRVCQGCVITMDLPTLRANPKQSQSESETQRSKGLSCPANTLADGPQPWGGRFTGRTVR